MLRIAITRHDYVAPRIEAREIIAALLDRGFDRVHIRKVDIDSPRLILENIPLELRRRISVHNADTQLIRAFPGIGVHLTCATPLAPDRFNGTLSKSCHTIEELRTLDENISYTFLSPIFDSVSKPGYQSRFSKDELSGASTSRLLSRCVALGGISDSHKDTLETLGFAGYAMLGNAWPGREQLSLQFISHVNSRFSTYEAGVKAAVEGGCRWIQLRMKGATTAQRIATAEKIIPFCHSAGAIVIIDDDVQAVNATDADGVHLGKNDMPIEEARCLLPTKIIGATANTAEDLMAAAEAGADYAGLGPFRWTDTKKGLSPILGIDGYSRIFSALRNQGIAIPTIAIGGITADDISPLLNVGAAGIAVSGTILNAKNPADETRKLIATIREGLKGNIQQH